MSADKAVTGMARLMALAIMARLVLCYVRGFHAGRAMRLYLTALAAILAGCSAQVLEPPAPQGDAPTKRMVADAIPLIFAASAHATDVLVTPARPAVEQGLFGWLVCVRARVAGISGDDIGFQTVAVFFQRREIVLRRRAEPQDKCEGFERIDAPG